MSSYLDSKCEDEHDENDCPKDNLTQVAKELVLQRRAKEQDNIDATANRKRRFGIKCGEHGTRCSQAGMEKPLHFDLNLPDGLFIKRLSAGSYKKVVKCLLTNVHISLLLFAVSSSFLCSRYMPSGIFHVFHHRKCRPSSKP